MLQWRSGGDRSSGQTLGGWRCSCGCTLNRQVANHHNTAAGLPGPVDDVSGDEVPRLEYLDQVQGDAESRPTESTPTPTQWLFPRTGIAVVSAVKRAAAYGCNGTKPDWPPGNPPPRWQVGQSEVDRYDQNPYFSLRSRNAFSPPSITRVISSRTAGISIAPSSFTLPPDWSPARR